MQGQLHVAPPPAAAAEFAFAPRARVTPILRLPAPAYLLLAPGEAPGSMVVTARRLPGAGNYELQIAEGDGPWCEGGIFRYSAQIVLEHLRSGVHYRARLRGLGSHGPGLWSAPAELSLP